MTTTIHSYTVTITRTAEIPGTLPNREGIIPPTVKVEQSVYEQTVATLDLNKVIAAVNGFKVVAE